MRNKIFSGKLLALLLMFSCYASDKVSNWNLKRNGAWYVAETKGEAKVNELRVNTVLQFYCTKDHAMFHYGIIEYEKLKEFFDLNNFDGKGARAKSSPLTTVEFENADSQWSKSFRQNGFVSAENRFVFESSDGLKDLAQLYKLMANEGNLLRIRIRSYRDPDLFLISEFQLKDSGKVMAKLNAGCAE